MMLAADIAYVLVRVCSWVGIEWSAASMQSRYLGGKLHGTGNKKEVQPWHAAWAGHGHRDMIESQTFNVVRGLTTHRKYLIISMHVGCR